MKDINLLITNGIDVKGSLNFLSNQETYDKTLEEFLKKINDRLNSIQLYKENRDMLNYTVLMQSLRNDARYLGFRALAELSYYHEVESKANHIDYVFSHYEELVEEIKRIITVVENYLGKGKEEMGALGDTQYVFIADDSHIIRNLIEKMLHGKYSVVTAQDGKEAIENSVKYQNHAVGLFLDLNMPNVNGFEVLQYFKDHQLFEKIPVAIITGDDSKETIYKAFDYPIVDVLAKPFNESDVDRVIHAMIDHK